MLASAFRPVRQVPPSETPPPPWRFRALVLVCLFLASLLLMASGCYTIEDDGATTTLRYSQQCILGLTVAWAIVGFVAAWFTSILVPELHLQFSRKARARQRRRGVLVAIVAGVIGVIVIRGMWRESVVITPTVAEETLFRFSSAPMVRRITYSEVDSITIGPRTRGRPAVPSGSGFLLSYVFPKRPGKWFIHRVGATDETYFGDVWNGNKELIIRRLRGYGVRIRTAQ